MMYIFKSRSERELDTIETMIHMYCRSIHKNGELCDSCSELLNYSRARIIKCVFGELKPVCNKCLVHCYKSNFREEIRKVMRFAGPRMIYTHPIMAIDHMLMRLIKHPEKTNNK